MRARITPLSVVTALFIVFAITLVFNRDQIGKNLPVIFSGITIVFALAIFVADMIIRVTVKDFKSIWIIEGILIIFAILIGLIAFNT